MSPDNWLACGEGGSKLTQLGDGGKSEEKLGTVAVLPLVAETHLRSQPAREGGGMERDIHSQANRCEILTFPELEQAGTRALT